MTVQEILRAHYPPLDYSIVIAAALQTVTKKGRNGIPYNPVERWAWRMRDWPEGSQVVLVGLGPNGEVEEVFSVPEHHLRGKKFLYRYRMDPNNRLGISLLDQFQVRALSASA